MDRPRQKFITAALTAKQGIYREKTIRIFGAAQTLQAVFILQKIMKVSRLGNFLVSGVENYSSLFVSWEIRLIGFARITSQNRLANPRMKIGKGSPCMNKEKGIPLAIAISVMLLGAPVFAIETSTITTSSASEISRYLSLNDSEVVEVSSEWGLTVEEWREYEKVMAGKRGLWSPGLDPIMALGVAAKTPAELMRYAELYVMEEFKRVERELKFQRAVNAAWKRLYPNTPRIGPMKRTTEGAQIERYSVVASSDCGMGCRKAMKEHLKLLDGASGLIGIDLYLADSADDDRKLRDWVNRERIPVELIQSGQVTVNHGGDFEKIGSYPIIYAKELGGKWIRRQ